MLMRDPRGEGKGLSAAGATRCGQNRTYPLFPYHATRCERTDSPRSVQLIWRISATGLLEVRIAAPGGRVVVLQYVLNDDRVSPPAAADLSLALLATTPGGDTYTFAELDRMFRNAGFPRPELRELPPMRVVLAYRSP
jgi:hypothetical protein